MSLTISESNAVLHLIDWLLRDDDAVGFGPQRRAEMAHEGAALLAAKARKALGAGMTEARFEELWPGLVERIERIERPVAATSVAPGHQE